jgi:hypothetical protein
VYGLAASDVLPVTVVFQSQPAQLSSMPCYQASRVAALWRYWSAWGLVGTASDALGAVGGGVGVGVEDVAEGCAAAGCVARSTLELKLGDVAARRLVDWATGVIGRSPSLP